MTTLPRFKMRFEPMTIEHLGLRLYSTLPPVISELVSNSHDAESPRVEITLPTGPVTATSEVVLRDFGHGMTANEFQNEFLPIGRNRRGKDSAAVMSKNGKVRITGRKGLGKLSAFGVATVMEVRSVRAGDAICLRLDYDEMKAWMEGHGNTDYEPTVVQKRTGSTNDPDGVETTLRGFHRTRPISDDDVRRGLARRLSFIGTKFKVSVNGKPIQPGDRYQRSDCPKGYVWDVAELHDDGRVGTGNRVTGWIGFHSKSSQGGRGVDIYANGKAVQLGSYFNFASTQAQWARAYLIGEVHADFLDAEKDLAATARDSVVWESDLGQSLQDWGQATLRSAFERWIDLRRSEKETEITTAAGFDRWLATRQESERRVAKRLLKVLVNDPDLDPKSAQPLLEIVKSSVETLAFRELVEAIESDGGMVTTLLKLFEEWRVIEAREHLRLADGRQSAIEQLDQFIEQGALEVQQMQPLFERNLWLIDATWSEASGQTRYTELLRKNCKEAKDLDDKDRRLDILGVRTGGEVTVVELKRPEKTLSRRDLEQVARYVDWARTNFKASGDSAPRHVRGLLVVGKMGKVADLREAIRRLAGDDIRVETYSDLNTRAKEYYGEAERILSKVAPEYARRHRKQKTQHGSAKSRILAPGRKKK